jgi:hypothetical protein
MKLLFPESQMKKFLVLAIMFTASVIAIGCSSNPTSSTSKPAAEPTKAK